MKNLFLPLLFIPQILLAQAFPVQHFTKNILKSPLHIPITLAGGYGEIRPGHFHEGLDMKTEGRIGLPVLAAADGYISRVAISNSGFGHVIYITHPDGYTTVYGHLHRFFPPLEKYVKARQYEQESWTIDLQLPPDLFPVKQGQFIAWSGATGSVAGPHLHFEVRNTESTHPMNGLLFGFDIKDNIPPTVYRIALYNMDKSIYEQDPEFYDVRKINGVYISLKNPILFNGEKIGFGMQALDHMNNTSSSFGIYEEILYADNKPQTGFQLNNIGYDETRYVDAHTDYKTFKETGLHFELLFSLPGNKLPVYYDFDGNGTIDLSDGKIHPIKILVRDADGNTSTVKFDVQKDLAYNGSEPTICANTMYANSRNIFENNLVQFYLEPGTLYDSICFNYHQIATEKPGYYSDIFQLGNSNIPLYHPFTLNLKLSQPVPDSLRGKMVIVRQDTRGRGEDIQAATWDGGWVHARFWNLGNFSIQADTIPPLITPLNIHDGANLSKANDIRFRITDDKSGVASYRAELDGKWLLFGQKGNVIYYNFDTHCPAGEHTLKLTVTDATGNQSVKIYHFKR